MTLYPESSVHDGKGRRVGRFDGFGLGVAWSPDGTAFASAAGTSVRVHRGPRYEGADLVTRPKWRVARCIASPPPGPAPLP